MKTLDLRDMFAAYALQGLLAMQASPNLGFNGTVGQAYFEHGRCDLMATDAYALADAMLAARKEKKA